MTTATWSTLSIDTTLALRTAASRLAEEFTGTFGTETIERFLHSSYDQLAQQAAVTKFLPLMAERFARQWLGAVVKVEGLHRDGKPTVLFLCTHNAGRSQIALGFFEALTGDRAVAWSGGSEPGPEVDPAAIAAMAERGIDISNEFPKPWTDETVRAADVVITMGRREACPIFLGNRYESWDNLDDPAGLDTTTIRPIRRRHRAPRPTADRRTRPHVHRESGSGAPATPGPTSHSQIPRWIADRQPGGRVFLSSCLRSCINRIRWMLQPVELRSSRLSGFPL